MITPPLPTPSPDLHPAKQQEHSHCDLVHRTDTLSFVDVLFIAYNKNPDNTHPWLRP